MESVNRLLGFMRILTKDIELTGPAALGRVKWLAELDGLRICVLKAFCGFGAEEASVFKGLGLLAALSKSKAESMTRLLDSISVSIENP